MCGRFTQTRPWPDLVALYRITEPVMAREPDRRYNIAPTDDIAVVRAVGPGGGRELTTLRWGLVPPWAKDPAQGARMINARAETVAEKLAFCAALRARRCLVIADGFYEWQAGVARTKQPLHIADPDRQPLAFAAVWERWRRPGAALLESCAIITTAASPVLSAIHDRMPAILPAKDHDLWLDEATPVGRLGEVLRPYPGPLIAHAVTRRVNSVKYDDPGCMQSQPAARGVFTESSPPLCHTR